MQRQVVGSKAAKFGGQEPFPRGYAGFYTEGHDFTSTQELAPARKFIKMLLIYLYTLPEQVKTAKSALSDLEINKDKSKAERQT